MPGSQDQSAARKPLWEETSFPFSFSQGGEGLSSGAYMTPPQPNALNHGPMPGQRPPLWETASPSGQPAGATDPQAFAPWQNALTPPVSMPTLAHQEAPEWMNSKPVLTPHAQEPRATPPEPISWPKPQPQTPPPLWMNPYRAPEPTPWTNAPPASEPAPWTTASPAPEPAPWTNAPPAPEPAPRRRRADRTPEPSPEPVQPPRQAAPAKREVVTISAPKQQPPSRAPVRPWRVAAILAVIGMLAFCGVVGGRLLMVMLDSERSTLASDYRERTGNDLDAVAQLVNLPPQGQTFAPTATPEPTQALRTPTPSPMIPLNENAIQNLDDRDVSDVQAPTEPSATPSARSRLDTYPKNPMHNITDGIAEMRLSLNEVMGQLVIEGLVDEIVVQRNNTYYLNHAYDGTLSPAGAVFIDESCSLYRPPENLILRGQSAVQGRSLEPLKQFITGGWSFAQANAYLTMTTLYESERYVLFGVIQSASDPGADGYFNYARPSFATDEEMLEYAQSVKANSLYDFGVDVQATDRLLTIATVDTSSTCVVLIYRMARDGESF